MKSRSRRWSAACCALPLLLLAAAPARAEWTSWRGPHQNGVSDETGLVSSWSPGGQNLLWTQAFTGRSTPVVFDGRVCANGRVGTGIDRQEVVACWDAVSGRALWEDRFGVYNTTVPFNRVGWASLVADAETGYVFAHGVAGHLRAYDRKGKLVWSNFLTETMGHLTGYGGRTQTPLVDGDQLILSFVSAAWGDQAAPRHRYYSFDKRTGDLLWVSTPGGMPKDMNTQSGQVVAEIGGRRLLIGGNADGWVYAMKADTGEKVWAFHLSSRGLNVTPVVLGDRVFISHSEENLDDATMGRFVAIDATGSGDVTETHEVWRINELTSGFPTPALHAGRLYVLDNSANLFAIDAASGTVRWEHSVGTVGKAAPVLADGKLYVTEVNGHFVILEPAADGARVLDKDELKSDGQRYAEIYGSPAIGYGRIYFTTEAGIYCLGDASRKLPNAKPARGKGKQGKPAPATGEPAWIQAVPAEVLAAPGESVAFEVRAFNAAGLPLGTRKATWKLEGLAGSVGADGTFRAAAGDGPQAGAVVATLGGLESRVRVRVIGGLPWNEDFSGYAVESVPPHWIGAKGKWQVQDKDGERLLVKLFRPKGLLRNALFMGPESMSDYTIQADVMGNKKGRRMTDSGLIAGGYTLDLMGNAQRVQLRSWPAEERMAQQVDFAWEPSVWYRMKLQVDVGRDSAVIRGKVWKRSDPEPAGWTIEVKDPYPIPQGSPGLLGYSPADVYYDNVKVMVNP